MGLNMFNPFSRSRWGRDIAFVLVVKVILLFLIWVFFVRGEVVQVDEAQMAKALHLESRFSPNSGGIHHDQ